MKKAMRSNTAGERLRDWWAWNKPEDAAGWVLLILVVFVTVVVIMFFVYVGWQMSQEMEQNRLMQGFAEGVIADMGKYVPGRNRYDMRYGCWAVILTPEGFTLKFDVSDSFYEAFHVGDMVTREDIIRQRGE